MTSTRFFITVWTVTFRHSKTLLGLTLAFALGAHWLMLQSVAWVGMIVTYSQDAPLIEAISMTFDGEHPCKLCKVVKEGKQAEQKQALVKFELKLDLLCAEKPVLLPPLLPFTLLTHSSAHATTRVEAPPGPPPRLA